MKKLILTCLGISILLSTQSIESHEPFLKPLFFKIPNHSRYMVKGYGTPKDTEHPITPTSTLKDYNERLVYEAINNSELAIHHLEQVEALSNYIPNLGDREHLKTLIAGSITAVAVIASGGEIVPIILALGLPLTYSLSDGYVDNFFKIRTHLIKAQHHADMSLFYRIMSIQFPMTGRVNNKIEATDSGSKAFYKGINYLNYAALTAQCLEDETMKSSILRYIDGITTKFLGSMDDLRRVSMNKEATYLNENISEVLADCSDEKLRCEIAEYVYIANFNFRSAAYAWGL